VRGGSPGHAREGSGSAGGGGKLPPREEAAHLRVAAPAAPLRSALRLSGSDGLLGSGALRCRRVSLRALLTFHGSSSGASVRGLVGDSPARGSRKVRRTMDNSPYLPMCTTDYCKLLFYIILIKLFRWLIFARHRTNYLLSINCCVG